jgi:uncharacterized surface protein with fasciclin (FAS1) repeats
MSISAGTYATAKLPREKPVLVGGAAMFPSKNIIQNAVNSKDHTTLVAAVQGENLTVTSKNGAVWLTDAKGGMSKVTIANVFQSNGVIHVVDTVLMP